MQLADARVSERPLFSERDRWFESAFLQQTVCLSPPNVFEGREPRLSARVSAAGLATGSAETRRVFQFARTWAPISQELHEIVENDRYPFSPRIRTLRGILAKLRPEPVRQAPAPTEGVRAAIERPIPETWLDDAQPSMTEFVAAPPPPLGRAYHQKPSRMVADAATWLDYAGVALAGFASIAASFAAGFKINLISRLRSRRVMISIVMRGLAVRAFSPLSCSSPCSTHDSLDRLGE
jgi:hypothetical protein